MADLRSLLTFTKFVGKLATTERFIVLPDTDTYETLTDHCTQLAYTAWFLNEEHKLNLNTEKLFKYALIHDIVETYTGDFPTHEPDCDRDEKARLEETAFTKMQQDFPEKNYLWEVYEQYEAQGDEESRFIYALDKLLPALNIYLDDCRAWKEREAETNSWSFNNLSRKIAHNDLITDFWNELRNKVKNEQPDLMS